MLSSSRVFSSRLSCCRAVGQQQSLLGVNPPGGDRHIAITEATEHFYLFAPGHNPQYPARPIEHRIRQRYPAPALVDAGRRHVRISYVEYHITRHQ